MWMRNTTTTTTTTTTSFIIIAKATLALAQIIIIVMRTRPIAIDSDGGEPNRFPIRVMMMLMIMIIMDKEEKEYRPAYLSSRLPYRIGMINALSPPLPTTTTSTHLCHLDEDGWRGFAQDHDTSHEHETNRSKTQPSSVLE